MASEESASGKVLPGKVLPGKELLQPRPDAPAPEAGGFDERASAPVLGGRWVGSSAAQPELAGSAAGSRLPACLLHPSRAVADRWWGGGPGGFRQQRHGCVRFATDGVWLYGHAEIGDGEIGADEDLGADTDGARNDGARRNGARRNGADSSGARKRTPLALQAAAHRAYADIFEVIAASPCPHVLRLWNYLADINRETGGVERYRQFNAGRQQAFIEARRSAFEGAPAASALGLASGPLQVDFLCGRAAPVAVENPRQVSAYRYPPAYGPCAPTFSRAALAEIGGGRTALFISGTASIVGHESVHLGDVRRQTEECLDNISAVHEAACARSGRRFSLGDLVATVYLRHAADLPQVREVFERFVGAGSAAAHAAIYLQADICRAELLVEIEAHVVAVGDAAA